MEEQAHRYGPEVWKRFKARTAQHFTTVPPLIGLSRLRTAQSGLHTTTRSYDSLSRLVGDAQSGRNVGYQRDDAGNATQIAYPSGATISRTFDPLDRLGPGTSPSRGRRRRSSKSRKTP